MGGNAFAEKTRRILKSEIFDTIIWLENEIQFPTGYMATHLLGSSGKKDDSGDVDLNIDKTRFAFDDVVQRLVQKFGANNIKARPGTNQMFTCIPINGDARNGFAQFDFMFGDAEWQEFSYFSPGTEKGLYRTEFIKAWIAYRSDWVKIENGYMIARVGPTFFHDRGLIWRYRHRPLKQNSTTERIKLLKEISKEEFFELYPDAIPASRNEIADPSMLHQFLTYGRDIENHYDTFEQTLKTFCKAEPTVEALETVKVIYQERLQSLKVEYPDWVEHEFISAIKT